MASQILKKLTLNSIGLDKFVIRDACLAATPVIEYKADGTTPKTYAGKGKSIDLAQFIGNVTGIKPGVNKDTGQTFVKLIGTYEAINLLTGEAFANCSTLMLPDFVANGIATAIQNGSNAIDFGVKITAHYNEKSAVGYEFAAESLMPTQESDAVSSIKARLLGAGVVLALPKAAVQLVLEVVAPVAAADVRASVEAEIAAEVPKQKSKKAA